MRVAEYKQVDVKQEEKIIIVPAEYDEQGNVVTEEHTETVVVEKPIMALVYRDMTAEEEAEIPMLGIEEIKQQLTDTVQAFMDSKVQERGYDNIASACSYYNSSVPKFANEGKACTLWRDNVWSYCYAQLDLFEAGKREIPTDIISELPKLEW